MPSAHTQEIAKEPIDLLISARWIAQVEPDTVLDHHAVAIRQGGIVDILPQRDALRRYQPAEHIQLDDHLLIPGLVNLHTHAAMSLMRGLADDLPLMDWLQQHIWPTEAAHVSEAFVRDGTLLAGAEMLSGGITCFNDMYFYQAAAAEAASQLGMRAALGITTLEFPTRFASDAADYLTKGLAVREQWIDHPLISFCLAPHAPYTVSDDSFAKILTLSEQLELPIHCHIHETQAEIDSSLEQHGCRPLARLQRLGLLGPNLIGVHAVHLTQAEIELLASSGCHVAHCPSSNLKLGSGIPSISKLTTAGAAIGLGTDGAASNNRLDLLTEMRLAALLAKGSTGDATALPARHVLRMATLNGATALGLDKQIGSIQTGKRADLCAVDLGQAFASPCFDPVSHLIYVAGREHVSHVWVDGKCCKNAGQLCTCNTKDLKKSAALWQNKIQVHRPGQ